MDWWGSQRQLEFDDQLDDGNISDDGDFAVFSDPNGSQQSCMQIRRKDPNQSIGKAMSHST